jgi:hypothetical protein
MQRGTVVAVAVEPETLKAFEGALAFAFAERDSRGGKRQAESIAASEASA